jgi:hypothetical protein
MTYRVILTAALLLGLGACAPLPHPFEDDKLGPHAPLLSKPDALGVVVGPVQGAADSAPAIAGAMALALQDSEVPASVEAGNSRSYHLVGTAVAAAGSPGTYDIAWSMRDAAGKELGRESGRVVLPPGADPDAAALAVPMRAVAPKLAALIQDSAPDEQLPTRHLLVREIQGAPGDGGKALKRSLVFLLKRSGIPLTDDAQHPDTVAVAAAVETHPAAAGQDHIKIMWHVLKPDGSEAGVITQENDVPHTIVTGQWGDMAMAVADAAAPDILRVAETVPKG